MSNSGLLGFWQFADDRQEEEVEAEIQEEVQEEMANKRAGKRANIYSSLPRGMSFKFQGSANMRAYLELVEGGVAIKAGSQGVLESNSTLRFTEPAMLQNAVNSLNPVFLKCMMEAMSFRKINFSLPLRQQPQSLLDKIKTPIIG